MFLFETTEISAKTKVLLNISIPLNLSAVQKFLTIFPCYGQKKLKVLRREQTVFKIKVYYVIYIVSYI